MGFALQVPPDWLAACDEQDQRWLGAALYGLAYLLRHSAPSLCMADLQDIDSDIALVNTAPERWKSALYLYDTHEGGVGYAEKIWTQFPAALQLCLDILRSCPCGGGCPACVPPLPPGVIDAPEVAELLLVSDASVRCTESLLLSLLTGEVRLPHISTREQVSPRPVTPPGEDQELLQLQRRLDRAAQTLEEKRGRLH